MSMVLKSSEKSSLLPSAGRNCCLSSGLLKFELGAKRSRIMLASPLNISFSSLKYGLGEVSFARLPIVPHNFLVLQSQLL